MKASVLLVLNTTATYTRSLLSIGLVLFSSRWILGALGEVDFGLFALVGSILLFITYMNSVLAASTSRHFAFAIGRGDASEVNHWFNAALSIHLCLALILTGAGWLLSQYIIFHLLNIPQEREAVCLLVYRISLVSLFSGMFSIPFVAMFRAKQRIVEISAWNMLQTLLNFCLAWFLLQASGDRLLVYAIGFTSILVFIHSSQIVRALIRFKECRIDSSYWFKPKQTKEIFSFAVWNFIGMSGLIFRNEGSAVLLNCYFGPTVNAAYSIAKKVVTQVDQLASAMLGAFSPEITAREGRGERDRMVRLSSQASKFGTLLILVFWVPLMLEMDYIFHLWLLKPPEYAVALCRLIMSAFLLDRFTTGYMLAINARGKIAAYQATVGTMLLLTLPLAWLFLYLGFSPTSVGGAFIITMALCSFGRVLWAKYLLQIPVGYWIKTVVAPCCLVGIFSATAALLPKYFLAPGLYRLLCVTVSSFFVYMALTWCYALDSKERLFFSDNLKKLRSKILLKQAS